MAAGAERKGSFHSQRSSALKIIRRDLQGQGLGHLLLADALTRAHKAALSVGSAGIFVDSKDDPAACFYRQ